MKNCASSWLFTRVTSKLSCISYKRQLTTCCSYTDRLLYMRLLLYDTCFKNDNSVCWFSKLLQMHITSEYNNRERWRVTRLRKTFTIINQLIYWLQETGVTGGGVWNDIFESYKKENATSRMWGRVSCRQPHWSLNKTSKQRRYADSDVFTSISINAMYASASNVLQGRCVVRIVHCHAKSSNC
jgi:hypothetical protein